MSEQNKAVAKRFYEEVFNQQHLNAIDQLCSPDFVDHTAMPGQQPGVKGLREMFAVYLKGFPDMHVTVEEMVAERDLVVTRLLFEGTHRGELLGAAPTGKRIKSRGLDMIRVKNGRATDAWHYGDDAVILMQLGVKLPVSAA